jgi:hypothetical protein
VPSIAFAEDTPAFYMTTELGLLALAAWIANHQANNQFKEAILDY